MDKIIFRDNLLITAATRAAYMDCAGAISLDTTEWGMEKLSKFLCHIVDRWIEKGAQGNFNEYIESNLILVFKEENEHGTLDN
jgi:hypothetical protein